MIIMFPYYKVYFKLGCSFYFVYPPFCFHTIKSILNAVMLLLAFCALFAFPYYKVYFKHYYRYNKNTIQTSRFPYYKVYFKPSTVHTLVAMDLRFHTIKSILNLGTVIIFVSIVQFPYYKVYFKPLHRHHNIIIGTSFHTIKSILNILTKK